MGGLASTIEFSAFSRIQGDFFRRFLISGVRTIEIYHFIRVIIIWICARWWPIPDSIDKFCRLAVLVALCLVRDLRWIGRGIHKLNSLGFEDAVILKVGREGIVECANSWGGLNAVWSCFLERPVFRWARIQYFSFFRFVGLTLTLLQRCLLGLLGESSGCRSISFLASASCFWFRLWLLCCLRFVLANWTISACPRGSR